MKIEIRKCKVQKYDISIPFFFCIQRPYKIFIDNKYVHRMRISFTAIVWGVLIDIIWK